MFRYCFATPVSLHVKDQNGVFSFSGLAGARVTQGFEVIRQLIEPYNLSHVHAATEPGECFERMEKNLSDISNMLVPLDRLPPYLRVAQVMFAGKVQFLTGYRTKVNADIGRESATVFSNFHQMNLYVYLWALCSLISFFLFISLRVLLFTRLSASISRRHVHPKGQTVLRVIVRQIDKMLNHSHDRLRLITLLYSLLCFFIVTVFMILYKTTHVIVERQKFPTSYQESLDHETSVPFFYDQWANISDSFREAPADSLKGKMWAKLLASGKQKDHSISQKTQLGFGLMEFLRKLKIEFWETKMIVLSLSLMMPMIKSVACGLGPDDELWFPQVHSDRSESEQLYARTMINDFSHAKFYINRLQRSFESHSLAHLYSVSMDATDIIHRFHANSSSAHLRMQKIACKDDTAFQSQPRVRAIPLSYFASFFTAYSIICLSALLLNLMQIICSRPVRKRATLHAHSSM